MFSAAPLTQRPFAHPALLKKDKRPRDGRNAPTRAFIDNREESIVYHGRDGEGWRQVRGRLGCASEHRVFLRRYVVIDAPTRAVG
jgi:hypothetical protein